MSDTTNIAESATSNHASNNSKDGDETSLHTSFEVSEEERRYQLILEIERLSLEATKQELKLKSMNPNYVSQSTSNEAEKTSKDSKNAECNEIDQIEQWVDADTAFRMRVDARMQAYYAQQESLDDDSSLAPMSQFELAEAIEQLEEKRRQLEEEGHYLEAQQVMNKIKEVNLIEGQKREQILERRKFQIKRDMRKKHQIEMQVFEEIWNEKTAEYDRQAKEIILTTVDRHKWEIRETEQQVRALSYGQKPKFSKQLLNMKNMLQKLVKQKMYEEAENLRRDMRPLELKELADYEQLQEIKIQQKMNNLKTKQQQELEALKQRIKKVKAELLSQKQSDLRRLELQQQNAMKDFDMKQRRVINKSKDFIGKQSSVLMSSPKKGTLDFSVLSFGQATFDKLFQQLHSPSVSVPRRSSSRLSNLH